MLLPKNMEKYLSHQIKFHGMVSNGTSDLFPDLYILVNIIDTIAIMFWGGYFTLDL